MFRDADLQREHYKTDWHRYNLKRKVADMGPVTLESFQQRMTTHEAQMKVLAGEVKEPTGYCVSCRKSFNTVKAYENHLNSKKHKETAANFEKKDDKVMVENNRLNRKESEADKDMEIEEVDSDEWEDEDEVEINGGGEPIPTNCCLFCAHSSKEWEKNLIHMMEKHSFFVPDADFVTDVEGLLEHLGEKVGIGFICLACDDRSRQFQSLDSVQRHMTDKGHCKLKTEGDAFLDYVRFYDYSTSYPTALVGGDDNEDDPEAEVEVNRLDDSGYELELPSGAKIGHRSLMRYYKQSLNPDRQVQARPNSMGRVLNRYKALGWTGLSGADAKKKAKDMKFMNKIRQKHYMYLGVKANKLQRHFLDPTGLC